MHLPKKPVNRVYWKELQEAQDGAVREDSLALYGLKLMNQRLDYRGGAQQQDRMIQDKRKTLDRAVLYSYQGAVIRKHYAEHIPLMEGAEDEAFARALINPNKLKPDYDDKVLSFCYYQAHKVSEIAEYLGISNSTYLRKQVLGNLEKQGYLESSKISRATYFKTNQEMVIVN